MKAKTLFLIGSLALSTTLFSGGGDEYFEKQIKEFIKQHKLELCFDEFDKRIIQKLVEKTKLTQEEVFEYFDEDARKKIRELAKEINVSSEWLYKLFYKEARLNPYATNPISGAQALIQFMPSTAKNLGTSVEELSEMSVEKQLPFIKLYLERINPSLKFDSFTDLYMAVFYPYYIGADDACVIGSEVSPNYVEKVAKQNRGIDKNKNNSITVGEFAEYANRC